MKKIIQLSLCLGIILMSISCNQEESNSENETINAELEHIINYDTRKAMPIPLEYFTESRDTSITLEALFNLRDSLFQALEDKSNEADSLEIVQKIYEVKILIHLKNIESICNRTDDSQDVELYDGKLGVTKDFVDTHEPSVAQIQWNANFGADFDKIGNSRGNVEDVRWCTGCLLEDNLFLTAGHCFDRISSWKLPRKGGRILPSEELVKLMHVNFNYQKNVTTGRIRVADVFPIEELVEYRNNGLDYAIVRLGRDENGRNPSDIYAALEVSDENAEEDDMICIIQHPAGNPKKIEAGPVYRVSKKYVEYDDVDTRGGSSGSPIISEETGRIVGVHTNGGCDTRGTNLGYSIEAILDASKILNVNN